MSSGEDIFADLKVFLDEHGLSDIGDVMEALNTATLHGAKSAPGLFLKQRVHEAVERDVTSLCAAVSSGHAQRDGTRSPRRDGKSEDVRVVERSL